MLRPIWFGLTGRAQRHRTRALSHGFNFRHVHADVQVFNLREPETGLRPAVCTARASGRATVAGSSGSLWVGLEAMCQEFGRRESPTFADCWHSPPSTSQVVAAGPCFARCTEAACQVPQGALPYTKVSTVAAGQACGIVPFRKAFGQLSVHKNLAVRSRGSTACVACWHSVPDMVGPIF